MHIFHEVSTSFQVITNFKSNRNRRKITKLKTQSQRTQIQRPMWETVKEHSSADRCFDKRQAHAHFLKDMHTHTQIESQNTHNQTFTGSDISELNIRDFLLVVREHKNARGMKMTKGFASSYKELQYQSTVYYVSISNWILSRAKGEGRRKFSHHNCVIFNECQKKQ